MPAGEHSPAGPPGAAPAAPPEYEFPVCRAPASADCGRRYTAAIPDRFRETRAGYCPWPARRNRRRARPCAPNRQVSDGDRV